MAEIDSNLPSLVRQSIYHSLSLRSPQTGARLMQQLKTRLVLHGIEDFNVKALGFKKFAHYLEKENNDLLVVSHPESNGDILVALRSDFDSMSSEESKTTFTLRNDLWQAFANPDPKRKRYFNLRSGEVIHFIPGSGSGAELALNNDLSNFIDILPISYEQQFEWLREFISSPELSKDFPNPNESIGAIKGFSVLSGAVSRCLGPKWFSAWKTLRTEKIRQEINKWADTNAIAHALLYAHGEDIRVKHGENLNEDTRQEIINPPVGEKTAKQKVVALIDLLTDEDVSKIVLPVLLSTILIKSRI